MSDAPQEPEVSDNAITQRVEVPAVARESHVPPASARRPAPRAAWLLAVLPLVGVLELGLFFRDKAAVVGDGDWDAARESVAPELQADDLVLFAPFWADPLGRRAFGPTIMTPARAAFADTTRFKRAFEIAIRGQHRPEIAGWRKVSERKAGAVTIGVYENPTPSVVHTDLVDAARPDRLSVSRVDGATESPCTFMHGTTQGGTTVVPQGTLVPGDRFTCQSGYVGVAVLHDLEHHPRRCIFTSLPGGGVRLRFKDVRFGGLLHGHDGVQWINERTASGERFVVAFSAFGRPIGQKVHKVGMGFTGFEFPTPEFTGQKGELVVDVSGPTGQRYFCFEADTRD